MTMMYANPTATKLIDSHVFVRRFSTDIFLGEQSVPKTTVFDKPIPSPLIPMRLILMVFCFNFQIHSILSHFELYRTKEKSQNLKRKRLYLMELDNGDKCYITEDTIVRFMLSRDKVIGEEELKEIRGPCSIFSW